MEGLVLSTKSKKHSVQKTSRLRVVWVVLLFLCFCVFFLFNPYFGTLLSAYIPDFHYLSYVQKWFRTHQRSASAGNLFSRLPLSPQSTASPEPFRESGIDAFSKAEQELPEESSSRSALLGAGKLSVRRAIKYFRWSHAAATQLQRTGASTIYFLFYEDREKAEISGNDAIISEAGTNNGQPDFKAGTGTKAVDENVDEESTSASRHEATSPLLSAFEDVAVDFSNKPIVHVSVPKSLMHHWEYIIPEDWADRLPLAMIVEMEQGWRKYVLRDRHLNYEKLRKFEEHYYDGVLLPSLRSEPAASVVEPRDGLVYPLVGGTFKKQVVDSKQDALVFFYAPWCGFCKRFEPKWKELAAEFRWISSIRFFKMDVTKNDIDHPHTRVERVPYVAFYRRGEKLEAPLKMDHSAEDVVAYGKEFILEHASCREIDLELGGDCFYEDLIGHEF